MTDGTIHFEVTSPVLTAEEARLLLDHLDNVQAAGLLGEKWDVWVAAKKKLVFIEYDGATEDAMEEQRAQDRASAESAEFVRRNS